MLTGDAKETAIAVGKQIGLVSRNCAPDGRGVAVSGAEIDQLGQDDLRTLVNAAAVFYRVTPRHKVRIVKALQVPIHLMLSTIKMNFNFSLNLSS